MNEIENFDAIKIKLKSYHLSKNVIIAKCIYNDSNMEKVSHKYLHKFVITLRRQRGFLRNELILDLWCLIQELLKWDQGRLFRVHSYEIQAFPHNGLKNKL